MQSQTEHRKRTRAVTPAGYAKPLSGAALTHSTKRQAQIASAKEDAVTTPEARFGEQTWLDVAAINIDHRYQRALNPDAIDRIVRQFDPTLFQPLTVSLREDNLYYAIDGQHRLFAAKALGMKQVPVVLHLDMTEAEEARQFVALQEKRIALLSHQKFSAQVLSGDPDAIALDKLLVQHGFRMVPGGSSTTRTSKDVFVAAKALFTMHRIDKGKTLGRALAFIRTAYPDDESNARIILTQSIVHFLRLHGDNPKFQPQRLTMRLQRMDVRDVTARAHTRGNTLRVAGHIAGSQVLQEMHDDGLRADKRLWVQV